MVVDSDSSWAAASVLFVFFYFILHMKSVMLAATGVILIALAFPLNAIINQAIIGNTYFSSIH